tara:strand:+ start:1203 stop:1493 length:291 start_codon:yes stop_codon:yes gene_type:complete
MSMKALLIVSALSGMNGGYQVEMPSFKDCLEARTAIMKQDKGAKTICVPSVAESDKMEKFFNVFMSLVTKMKELEIDGREIESLGKPDSKCPTCER